MRSQQIWANFSVAEVGRTKAFYTALGFAPNGKNDHPELASFLFGANGFIIHFFQQGSQIDQYLTSPAVRGEIVFSLSAGSEEEIRDFAEKVRNAGGTIFSEAGRDKDQYYTLGFADPDGHRFNLLLIEEGM